MMNKKLILVVVSIFIAITSFSQIRVACVGNSITFGAGIVNRELNSYPAQLQCYLGDGYEVKNFGVSGTVVLQKGDKPYVNTQQYQQSLDFNPDIVLIKLGTNDSKSWNMEHFDDFKADYQKIIDSYRAKNSDVRIVLLTPVRCYQTDEEKIYDPRIRAKIAPAIEELAYENNLEIFDNYSLFGTDYRAADMPDKLHPSSLGAGIMAFNYDRFLTRSEDATFDIFNSMSGGDDFNFHGFKGKTFEIEGLNIKVVQPKIANKKHSWVLRARFWGHEPQLDLKLLEQGFHIAYCDVADLFGSPVAVKRWDKFYKLMTSYGLCDKVVLEGMSRGGLIVYNWAAKNSKKVSAIYADAPVMDLKSWPMGDKAKNSATIEKMLEAYGDKSYDEMMEYGKNPIDQAKKIAKSKIPIIHVVGETDEVVPVAENTTIFEERLKDAGHEMKIISKAGVGHHPHSLSAPEQILRFILKAEGESKNHCIQPIRGSEYRAAAGWRDGADWNRIAEDITTTLAKNKVDILMLGNSITQGAANKRPLVGSRDMTPYFKEYSWESAGISGDKTQHLLWRLINGKYNAASPKYVTIAIGVNNLGADDDAASTLAGILAVVEAAQNEFKDSKIILFGLLPTASKMSRLDDYYWIQSELKKIDFDDQVLHVDPTPYFTDEEGMPRADIYRKDMIHLENKGYQVWGDLIYKTIKENFNN